MVFEIIGDLVSGINLLGVGMYIAVAGIIFAIVNGLTKDEEDGMLYAITITAFASIMMFATDGIQTMLYVTGALLIIVYVLKYMGNKE